MISTWGGGAAHLRANSCLARRSTWCGLARDWLRDGFAHNCYLRASRSGSSGRLRHGARLRELLPRAPPVRTAQRSSSSRSRVMEAAMQHPTGRHTGHEFHARRPRPSFLLCSLVTLLLPACRPVDSESRSALPPEPSGLAASPCPTSAPAWARPPEDSAVPDAPGFGYYFLNADQSIWASASWAEDSERRLRVGDRGVKVGWFRPAGAPLEITGQRLDAQSPPLVATIPCCYPTRFQATSLLFPTGGCWRITAKAASSVLSYVVKVSDE